MDFVLGPVVHEEDIGFVLVEHLSDEMTDRLSFMQFLDSGSEVPTGNLHRCP